MKFSFSVQISAFLFAFIASALSGIALIPALKKLRARQTIRDDGPATHLKKTGVPTIGGLIFMVPVVVLSIIFSARYPEIIALMLVTAGFGFVGFADDYIKISRRSKDGLKPKQKLLALLVIAAAFTFYIAVFTNAGTSMTIPFVNPSQDIQLPVILFIPFIVFVFLSTTNGVNLTDGLDGLASSVTLVITVFFAILAGMQSDWEYIRVFSSLLAGGCLGFLIFNSYPAKVIMGDTGSLALGGAVAAISVVMGIPWIILIVGIVYVIETLSVIVQVISFKTTGKRVFKMAPLHHHFELSGWSERKVVMVFTVITIIFCIFGFFTVNLK